MPDQVSDTVTRRIIRGAVVVAAACSAIVPSGGVARERQSVDPGLVAARSAAASMSLADRAAQLVVTSVPGVALDSATRLALQRIRPGGVIVFSENVRSRTQLLRWTRALQGATRSSTQPGLLVSIDQEGGVVKRIADAPPMRSHPQLGAADRPVSTRQHAVATARTLLRLGIHWNLAPVADLDLGPRHVMGERSFGSDPDRVARHVEAFVAGLQAGGGAAAVKHFPGFGSASVNSDDALARITRTRVQLERDLVPFRAAVAANADAVMVSHAIYTAVDRRHPATTSAAVYRILRGDLGFRGVAVTDSLHARGFAAAARTSVANGCVAAVTAGADMVLVTGPLRDAMACRRALIVAIRSGALPRARVEEAVTRVLLLKSTVGLLPSAQATVSSSVSAG